MRPKDAGFTPPGAADGEWTRVPLAAGRAHGPYYHVDAAPWRPSRLSPFGRWAGADRPRTKAEAVRMFDLGHLDKSRPWTLYTFRIRPGRDLWLYTSKVKDGTSTQVKLPDAVCDFVEIEREEPLP